MTTNVSVYKEILGANGVCPPFRLLSPNFNQSSIHKSRAGARQLADVTHMSYTQR